MGSVSTILFGPTNQFQSQQCLDQPKVIITQPLTNQILSGGVRVDNHNGAPSGAGFANGGGRGYAARVGGALGHGLAHV